MNMKVFSWQSRDTERARKRGKGRKGKGLEGACIQRRK